jgi:hypothetical protein
MPENEMTPDPVFDKLSRFSPSAGTLDRDAILFAAGRASARSRRLWAAVAGVLAVTQAITLALLLMPRPAQQMPVQNENKVPPVPTMDQSPESAPDNILQVRSDFEHWPKESPVNNPVPSGPTWTVRSANGFSLD